MGPVGVRNRISNTSDDYGIKEVASDTIECELMLPNRLDIEQLSISVCVSTACANGRPAQIRPQKHIRHLARDRQLLGNQFPVAISNLSVDMNIARFRAAAIGERDLNLEVHSGVSSGHWASRSEIHGDNWPVGSLKLTGAQGRRACRTFGTKLRGISQLFCGICGCLSGLGSARGGWTDAIRQSTSLFLEGNEGALNSNVLGRLGARRFARLRLHDLPLHVRNGYAKPGYDHASDGHPKGQYLAAASAFVLFLVSVGLCASAIRAV